MARISFELLKVGAVVGPVATGDGFALVKLLGRIEGSQLEFEQIKDGLMAEIRDKIAAGLWQGRLWELRQLPFWADEQLIASITERYLSKDP